MDSFIKDVSDVEEIPNVRMIDYKGQFCMVRMLKKDSAIQKMNPDLKYLVRYSVPKTPKENKLYSILYVPISEKDFQEGLINYKKEMEKIKSDIPKMNGGRKTLRKNMSKNKTKTKKL
jgi:hypothetical protein